mgnify:CR=1 FL=1|tara:strand:+ start:160828 stop:161673 length:846 start_codon:yes stop_codon:yes gene_type:complete
MKETLQTEGLTVYEHGESVWEYTKKIISGDFNKLKLPDWFKENHRFIVNNLHDIKDVKDYNIYHDCGKPFCLEIDSDGKRHFKNHAQISKETWLKISDNQVVADLIGYDMALHSDNADTIKSYDWDIKTAFTLLVTAFAEIHSNAEMFGGIDSISFKMKWKTLDRRGKMLMKMFNEECIHPYSYVIVRNDLPENQKSIQGTHAAIEQFRNKDINFHPSVIYIVVKNENKLKSVISRLIESGINISIFREPMSPYDNSITAVCTEPITGDKREYLKNFMLLQ